MMRMMPGILAVALRNSLVASVGHVPLLLLAAVVVVSAGHDLPLAESMRFYGATMSPLVSRHVVQPRIGLAHSLTEGLLSRAAPQNLMLSNP